MASKQYRSINLTDWRRTRAYDAVDATHPENANPKSQMNEYRLVFLPNQVGLGKMIEIDASNLTSVIEFAANDIFRRNVEIWENGSISCILERDDAAE